MFMEWYEKNKNKIDAFDSFFPDINNREKWKNISPAQRQTILRDADLYLGFDWPICKASDHLRFHTDGNRKVYETELFKKRDALASLVLGQCVLGPENKKYAMDILNGIVAICEESYWGASAHCHLFNPGAPYFALLVQNRMYPILDLFTAETGNMLAYTLFLLKNFKYYDTDDGSLGTQLFERVKYEIKSRVLTPYLEYDFYWWMGIKGDGPVNNWNPWITNNVLSCLLVCEDDPDYIKKYLDKVFICLDNYYNTIPEDGGCDEGPSYWFRAGHALFQCLYLLYHATNGKINFFDDEKIIKMGSYLVSAHISDNIFANFADCPHKIFENPFLISLYGKYTRNDALMRVGEELKAYYSSQKDLPRTPHFDYLLKSKLEELFEEIPKTDNNNIKNNYFLENLQFASMKQNADSSGFVVVAKGGTNDESHNHNDIGNFIVYADKNPLFIDVGVETYTQKTFSEHRYELWTMQSGWHNVPIVNGVEQLPGIEYRGENCRLLTDGNTGIFTVDFQKAYNKKSNLLSLNRKIRLNDSVKITDDYKFSEPSNSISQIFLSVVKPTVTDSGLEYHLEGNKKAVLEFDNKIFDICIEEKNIEDPKLSNDWGNKIYRTKLNAKPSSEFSADYTIKII